MPRLDDGLHPGTGRRTRRASGTSRPFPAAAATGAARSCASRSSRLTRPRPSTLIKFLTSPAAEKAIFKQTGNLPSQPALLKSPAVKGFKNPFFNNAPVGKIFATSALKLKPQISGPAPG